MFALGGENVAYLLTPGKHRIRLVKGMEGPGVSLLPLWGKVRDISSQVTLILFCSVLFYYIISYLIQLKSIPLMRCDEMR